MSGKPGKIDGSWVQRVGSRTYPIIESYNQVLDHIMTIFNDKNASYINTHYINKEKIKNGIVKEFVEWYDKQPMHGIECVKPWIAADNFSPDKSSNGDK